MLINRFEHTIYTIRSSIPLEYKVFIELIRFSQTLFIDRKPGESLEDIIEKLKNHVKYNTQFDKDED